jgi:hypothetical protein
MYIYVPNFFFTIYKLQFILHYKLTSALASFIISQFLCLLPENPVPVCLPVCLLFVPYERSVNKPLDPIIFLLVIFEDEGSSVFSLPLGGHRGEPCGGTARPWPSPAPCSSVGLAAALIFLVPNSLAFTTPTTHVVNISINVVASHIK